MQGTRVCSIPSNHGGNSDQQVEKVGLVWEKNFSTIEKLRKLRSIVSKKKERLGYKCDIWTSVTVDQLPFPLNHTFPSITLFAFSNVSISLSEGRFIDVILLLKEILQFSKKNPLHPIFNKSNHQTNNAYDNWKKKKKGRKIICTKHSTASDHVNLQKLSKQCRFLIRSKRFIEKSGRREWKKKIFSTLCEQCLRGGGTISRNMKTASKSDGGRSEIGKQRFAQSCARKAWNCVRRAIATNNYYQADPFVWHRRK